jgi:hypothetical protein
MRELHRRGEGDLLGGRGLEYRGDTNLRDPGAICITGSTNARALTPSSAAASQAADDIPLPGGEGATLWLYQARGTRSSSGRKLMRLP